MKELKGQIVTKDGNGYTELFRAVRPQMLDLIIREFTEKKGAEIVNSLKNNPTYNGCQTYPCFTVFQETAIHQLISTVGGKMLTTDTLQKPIHAQTDSGEKIEVRGLLISER
jgi:hypothetical protein